MLVDRKRRFNKTDRPSQLQRDKFPNSDLISNPPTFEDMDIHCPFGEESDPNADVSELAILHGTTIAQGQNWYHQFGEE